MFIYKIKKKYSLKVKLESKYKKYLNILVILYFPKEIISIHIKYYFINFIFEYLLMKLNNNI